MIQIDPARQGDEGVTETIASIMILLVLLNVPQALIDGFKLRDEPFQIRCRVQRPMPGDQVAIWGAFGLADWPTASFQR
jgi:hypothetical protein